MPQTRSANKKLRVDERRRAVNLRRKRGLKDLVKKARETKTAEAIRQAVQQIDKAVKMHIMHRNKGARMKSQLMNGKAPAKTTAKKSTKTAAKKPASKKAATKKPATKKRGK